jgi:NTP pyrophosphatase (non-canonical NTP hydrolase)
MLNELAKEIHEEAKAHGWYEKPREIPEVIALMYSELSEALEEYRDGKPAAYFVRETSIFPQYGSFPVNETDFSKITHQKPEGVAVEFADCIIRILDTCAYMGYDIDEAMRVKMVYNKTRSYRHGGKKV